MKLHGRLYGAPLLVLALLTGCANSPAQPDQTSAPSAPVAALATPTTSAAVTPIEATPTLIATATASPGAQSTDQPTNSAAVESPRTLALEDPRVQGDDVRELQTRLTELGYTQVGAIDGVFGPQTEAAVRAFQAANALEVDGVVGPQTRERLFAADAAQAAVPVTIVDARLGYLIGAGVNGSWADASAAEAQVTDQTSYRLFTLDGEQGTVTGSAPRQAEEICPDTRTVDLAPDPTIERGVAVSGTANPQPRPIQQIAPDQLEQPFVASVNDLLQQEGIAEPELRVSGVLRADLDGDGSDETIVSATRYAENAPLPTANAGDYSLVVVMQSRDQTIVRFPIAVDLYAQPVEFGAPNVHTVTAVLDLNNDGRMEVVVDSDYYEGGSTGIYTIEGDQMRQVLIAGCGV